jgi:hypothetical protein
MSAFGRVLLVSISFSGLSERPLLAESSRSIRNAFDYLNDRSW